MLRRASLALLAGALLLAHPLAAQERRAATSDSAAALPEEAVLAVLDFVNDPRRLRFSGPTRIPADSVVAGDVAVLEGPLTLEGRVAGSVAVVNGGIQLLPGARIDGDLLVVGGRMRGLDSAYVAGEIRSYPEPLRYRLVGRRLVREESRVVFRGGSSPIRIEEPWGHSDFLVTAGKSYNRVEGLPIVFGPRVETEGSNPLRVQALAVYRTENGFTLDTDRMGYYVRAEQFLGGRRALSVGAGAHSLIDPIEEWHLTDLENSLATLLFHQDHRDHFERVGGTLFTSWQPPLQPYSLTLEGRWERHHAVAPGSPWSLFDNADAWRAEPLVAEGRVGSVALLGSYDTRSHATDPATGWYLQGRVEQAYHSGLARPAFHDLPLAEPAASPEPGPEHPFGRFSTARVDLRRYNRVDPTSRLNFRLLAAGSLNGSPLPPQYQHALGGEGSLPGYPLFSRDCGARERAVTPVRDAGRQPATPYYAAYGCDAFALFQAEYRGKLAFRFRWDGSPWRDDGEDAGWGFGWDFAPDWALFVDAGRGWSFGEGRDEKLAVDAGVGILVERFGVYLATPLSGGKGVNVFVRLGPRF